MLLAQWGIYDWGEGEFFEFDIIRQLISVDAMDDDDIWHLNAMGTQGQFLVLRI